MEIFYCLISGSLTFDDYGLMSREADRLLQNHDSVCIVTGNDKGTDRLAQRYANERGFGLKIFYADWATYHRDAGKECNKHMYSFLSMQDRKGAILFTDGNGSGGLYFKMSQGKELGIQTRIIRT